jgi:peptidoglycan/LPS O-acetylase OafA/YrhL
MLSHLAKWKHISFSRIEGYGTLGVHVFFVLSGYLITSLLLQEQLRTSQIDLRNFYIRRAFRIFPAAFVFIGVATFCYWSEIHWAHLAAALFYVSNMDLTRPWIFGHLWSLSIEEQFYLVWPFVLKRWSQRKILVLFAVLMGTPAFITLMYALRVHTGVASSLPVFADQLAIGCLLAVFANRLPRIPSYVAILMVAGIVVIPLFPATSALRTLTALFVLRPVLNICIAGTVLHVIQTPYRAINCAPVVWLGKISYSLYLWQEFFCSNPQLHFGYALIIPAILSACLSYYLVEQPMLRVREKRARKCRDIGGLLQPASHAA